MVHYIVVYHSLEGAINSYFRFLEDQVFVFVYVCAVIHEYKHMTETWWWINCLRNNDTNVLCLQKSRYLVDAYKLRVCVCVQSVEQMVIEQHTLLECSSATVVTAAATAAEPETYLYRYHIYFARILFASFFVVSLIFFSFFSCVVVFSFFLECSLTFSHTEHMLDDDNKKKRRWLCMTCVQQRLFTKYICSINIEIEQKNGQHKSAWFHHYFFHLFNSH